MLRQVTGFWAVEKTHSLRTPSFARGGGVWLVTYGIPRVVLGTCKHKITREFLKQNLVSWQPYAVCRRAISAKFSSLALVISHVDEQLPNRRRRHLADHCICTRITTTGCFVWTFRLFRCLPSASISAHLPHGTVSSYTCTDTEEDAILFQMKCCE